MVVELNACTCAHLVKPIIPPSLPSAASTPVDRCQRLREDHLYTTSHVRTPSGYPHYSMRHLSATLMLRTTRQDHAAVDSAVLGDAFPLKIIQEVEDTHLRSDDRKGGSCDSPQAPSSCPTARGRSIFNAPVVYRSTSAFSDSLSCGATHGWPGAGRESKHEFRVQQRSACRNCARARSKAAAARSRATSADTYLCGSRPPSNCLKLEREYGICTSSTLREAPGVPSK